MAAAKYKAYFDQMFEQHRDEFMHFMLLNNEYGADKPRYKQQFDAEGAKIQTIVQEWEDRLCKKIEKGERGVFSAKLGEKFQQEVLKYFPFYHEIGVRMTFVQEE